MLVVAFLVAGLIYSPSPNCHNFEGRSTVAYTLWKDLPQQLQKTNLESQEILHESTLSHTNGHELLQYVRSDGLYYKLAIQA